MAELLSPELIKLVVNGGVTAVIFIIWYISFTRITRQNQEAMDHLIKLLHEDIKYKEILTGLLNRVELKVDMLSKQYPSHW
ncbi:MAG: hypothetical protein IT279_08295 [Ignavibacteriaceae bacterium]|nr:hypothetical protein [Ignavibacteriaceae bacterium]